MPPAIPPSSGGSIIDPTWITAASSVLGSALSPGNAGPSRADTGGMFSFSAPFVVTTGTGDASAAGAFGLPSVGSIAPLALVAIAGLVAWRLLKKS